MSQSNKEINNINQIITFSQFKMYINMFKILKKKKKIIYIYGKWFYPFQMKWRVSI